jgi:ethanolamine utilization protein EutN
MIIGTVTGQVYATIAHPFYRAKALLLVEREDASGARTGAYILAVDTVGAGVGQRVLVLDEGTGGRQIMSSTDGPVKSVIVGIVDDVTHS